MYLSQLVCLNIVSYIMFFCLVLNIELALQHNDINILSYLSYLKEIIFKKKIKIKLHNAGIPE